MIAQTGSSGDGGSGTMDAKTREETIAAVRARNKALRDTACGDQQRIAEMKLEPVASLVVTTAALADFDARGIDDVSNIEFVQGYHQDIPAKMSPLRCCIHNFANADYPGIRYPNAGVTQEEMLLRCFPELYHSLKPRPESSMYPLNCTAGDVIVTDYVAQWRGSDSLTPVTDGPKAMFLTAAAPDHFKYKFDEAQMVQHWRNVLRAPLKMHSRDDPLHPQVMVLGAWGCGAFAPYPRAFEAIQAALPTEYASYTEYKQIMTHLMCKVLITEGLHRLYDKVLIVIPDQPSLDMFKETMDLFVAGR